MTAEHTPGPWTIIHRGRSYRISADHNVICQSFQDDPLTPQNPNEQKANAHLIAAAPEMFSALREIAAHGDEGSRERARAAIAQAEGGA